MQGLGRKRIKPLLRHWHVNEACLKDKQPCAVPNAMATVTSLKKESTIVREYTPYCMLVCPDDVCFSVKGRKAKQRKTGEPAYGAEK